MGNGENKESKESQANKKSKENKMGVMPVKKLIINMSVPMMISMLVQALYNVVDSIFVAQVSKDALAAVTYAFPMQTMMITMSGMNTSGFILNVSPIALMIASGAYRESASFSQPS